MFKKENNYVMQSYLCVLNVYRQNNHLKKKANNKHSKHISMDPCVEWGV